MSSSKTPGGAARGKVRAHSAGNFAKGGTNADVKRQHAAPHVAGVTGATKKGDGGKFPSGGNGKMFGKGHAMPMRPGSSRKAKNG